MNFSIGIPKVFNLCSFYKMAKTKSRRLLIWISEDIYNDVMCKMYIKNMTYSTYLAPIMNNPIIVKPKYT